MWVKLKDLKNPLSVSFYQASDAHLFTERTNTTEPSCYHGLPRHLCFRLWKHKHWLRTRSRKETHPYFAYFLGFFTVLKQPIETTYKSVESSTFFECIVFSKEKVHILHSYNFGMKAYCFLTTN